MTVADGGEAEGAADRVVEALRAVVAASRQVRVPLESLWSAAEVAHPRLQGSPDARRVLRAAIDALAHEGVVLLPRATTKGWDQRGRPELPGWVRRPAQAQAPTRPPRVWPAVLEPAAAVARGTDLEALERIADWLRDHPGGAGVRRVPVEERSAQVFGDEKRLNHLLTSRLFTQGLLTLDLLACHRTPLPLASQYVPGTGAPTLLVCENAATYYSCLTAARESDPGSRSPLHVAWGRGNEVVQSLASLRWLDPAPVHVAYFGDLDAAGLRIAATLAGVGGRDGLPLVLPAAPLYARLLDVGRPVPDRSGVLAPADADRVAAWLGPALWARVEPLVAAGRRLAQEQIGLERLLAEPDLLRLGA